MLDGTLLCGLDAYVTVLTSDVQRAKLISQKRRKRRSNSTFQRWNLSGACLVACFTALSHLEGKYRIIYLIFFLYLPRGDKDKVLSAAMSDENLRWGSCSQFEN